MNKVVEIFKRNIKLIIAFIIIIFLFNYRLPYNVMMPGGLIDISNRVVVDGGNTINGSMNLLYVTETKANIPTLLLSYILDSWDLESVEEEKISDESDAEIIKRNKAMLDNSIQNAIFVAYGAAGRDITITGKKNIVIGLFDANDSNLQVGDEILKANGVEIDNVDKLRAIINESNVEDIIELDVIRDEKEIKVSTKVFENDGIKQVGMLVITNYQYELDPAISLKFRSSESGASGGLMLALSIYDIIGDEDIVKGRKIAGTGAITMSGAVEEIGGVKYKLMGAVRNNVDVVLVPESNYEECIRLKEKYKYDIEIVSVATFDDALNYLQK
ncbi:MAG: S16 family serine protease [bacterium]|nr:S16 family serine protease [bacterium]